MHADELRMAATKIVEVLNKSDILGIVDQYRSSKGDQRTSAAARLGHAGAIIKDRIDAMSPAERQVVDCLHLDTLGSSEYWQELLESGAEPKRHRAEIVRLASRVMFATSHLPGMLKLLETVNEDAGRYQSDIALEAGEGVLLVRLTDAGERASDPDRVARAIDGVDMLYSACASIAGKPAMDLRLDGLVRKHNRDRDLQFSGELDSLSAVYAVIDSIPAALADINPDQGIDLGVVVQSLPIFEDLNALASLGTFSEKDLKDISDTMHQGALLTLESGVILMDSPSLASVTPPEPAQSEALVQGMAADSPGCLVGPGKATVPSESSEALAQADSAAGHDEHYDRYLREREAMLRPQESDTTNGHDSDFPEAGDVGASSGASEDENRREAVEKLLKYLNQTRSS